MSILAPKDFAGKFLITKNAKNIPDIQAAIDKTEFRIMNELFGKDMYADYLVGVNPNTPDPLFIKLQEPFFENSLGVSEGIKVMLLGFTFFDYYQTDTITAAITGQQVTKSENSEKVNVLMNNSEIKNDSIVTFNVIKNYVRRNSSDYTNYGGCGLKLLDRWF